MSLSNDDGPGRPVTRDEPYYPEGSGPGQPLLAHCHLCGELVPIEAKDYRWFVFKAIKAGWRLAKLKTGDEWTCPGCAAVARANLDAAIREEAIKESDDGKIQYEH